MKVLSLFDGIACGYEALLRAGIKVDAYYASEIDKYAIQIAQKNHPDIIQLGDVKNIEGGGRLSNIDLLIGGSPCQGFSIAGKMLNFDDPRSKLFFEFVRILKEVKPKYFLLENVKMKKEWQDIISRELGVEPIEINSSLVSAQSRRRLYRTNIPNVTQPQDKGIMLKDILQENVDEKYNLTDGAMRNLIEKSNGELRIKQATKQGYIVAEEGDGISLSFDHPSSPRSGIRVGKANTLVTGGDSYVYEPKMAYNPGTRDYLVNGWKEGKSYTISSMDYAHPKIVAVAYAPSSREFDQQGWKTDKSPTICARDYKDPKIVNDGIKIRKLTPIECERLQTLTDNYTEGVSDTQRYKMLGNGRTVDVIAHIFKNLS